MLMQVLYVVYVATRIWPISFWTFGKFWFCYCPGKGTSEKLGEEGIANKSAFQCCYTPGCCKNAICYSKWVHLRSKEKKDCKVISFWTLGKFWLVLDW